jgi:hypothetical protein
MGNRQNFETNWETEGQGPDVLITLDHLGLTQPEIGKFWRAFCRIDRNKTGLITRTGLSSLIAPFTRDINRFLSILWS